MKTASSLFTILFAFCVYSTTFLVPKTTSSIQSAIEKADAGDTVFVLNGLYRESITLKDGIVLFGESSQKTVIQGRKSHPVIKGAEGAVVKNFTIENGSVGILSENSIFTIEQNLIRDNKGTGIHCLISLPAIRNNVISNNHWTGIFCESVRSIKTSIDHNVVAENGYSGIMLAGRSEVLIQNNVFFKNRQFGIWAGDESEKSRIVYNDFFDNRNSVNFFTHSDKSNICEDPGYPVISGQFNYIGVLPTPLKGKGKDGATVGVIDKQELIQIETDPDGDEVTGAKDNCPSLAEDKDEFQDDDGCPDFDNDNDGIYDTQDQCPNLAEDKDGFMDDDGCPDPDNDKDGIPDQKDVCPINPEVYNGYKDDDGCPDEVPADMNKPSKIQTGNQSQVTPDTSKAAVSKAGNPAFDYQRSEIKSDTVLPVK